LYFPVYNNGTGQYDLWRSNGIASGTYIIKPNINPYNQPVAVGNTLFFNNYDDEHGYELWKSNGTTKGTTLVKDIIPGTESSDPQNLHSFNGKLFFSAINYYNYVLYSSDGTEAGTTLVKYVAVGSNFAQANGKLFFYGYRNIAKGSELYATDGTEAGTYLVKDIAQGPMSSNVGGTFYSGDTLIYFIAYDLKHGSELWRSNGTKAGTYLLKNITPGDGGTYLYPPGAVNINDNLIFVINDTLWQSDGTKQGTYRVHDKTVEGVFAIFELTAAHGKVYFAGNTYAAGREVYVGKIDGETGKFVVSKTTNVDAVKTSLPFKAVLYPNPVKNTLNIKIAAGNINNVTLLITDVSGKTMLAKSTFAGNGEIITQLNVSRLSAGTYFLKIINTDGSENAMMKFVK